LIATTTYGPESLMRRSSHRRPAAGWELLRPG
jgi:hypothetical protein